MPFFLLSSPFFFLLMLLLLSFLFLSASLIFLFLLSFSVSTSFLLSLSLCLSSSHFSSLSLSLRLSSCLCYSRLSSLTRRAASDSMVILAMNLHISVSSLFNWTVAADSSSGSACSATFLWLTAITFRALLGLFRPSFFFYCPSLSSFW